MPGITLGRRVTIEELAARFGGDVLAVSPDRVVERVTRPADASRAGDLCVLTHRRYLEEARAAAGVVLASPLFAGHLGASARWVHERPLWVLAELLVDPSPDDGGRIHSTAVIGPRARLGPGVSVGAGAVVQDDVHIGVGTVVGENAVLYSGCRLGRRVRVGPLCVVGSPGFGWVPGEARRIPQRAGVVLEDDVELGALCTVDAGTLGPTSVGARTKLDAHVHVGHNVAIGPDVRVAAQSGFAGSSRLGAGVWVGGQAGVAEHIDVGAHARIGGKTGVVRDVPSGRTVLGFPAVERRRWLRAMVELLGKSER